MTLVGRMPGTLLLILLALCPGCSEALPVTIHPASGKVFLADGKPLTSGTVYLEPVDHPVLKATGKIQADGSFTLTTRTEGDGAPEGDCLVYILPESASTGKESRPFPAEYTDPESSKLRVTIRPGTNDLEPFVLKQGSRGRGSSARPR